MSQFYTSVVRLGGKIFHRGFRDGRRFQEEIKYRPYFFVPSKNQNARYSTLDGKPLDKLEFDDVWEQSKWVQKYRDVDNWKYYGSTNIVTTYTYDTYPGEISFDPSLIRVAIIDIECGGLINGPDFIDIAPVEITSIAMKVDGKAIAFGMKDFVAPEGVKYFKCRDESVLLKTFLTVWERLKIDVMSGWNIEGFDVPYLINRITRVLTGEDAKRLSPWKSIRPREVPDKFGRVKKTYDIEGIAILDYQELYKKFTVQIHGQLESYSLNYVSYFELGEEKIDYSEFGSLPELYEKNFQRYIEYNIHDCELVQRIDDRRKFLELVYEIAFIAKCQFSDVLKTIPVWEALIHAYLLDRRIAVPLRQHQDLDFTIPGGFVKEPIPGLYKWVLSFDVASLYPHLIMQYNLSPEMLRTKVSIPSVDSLVEGAKFDPGELSVAATGCGYSREKAGFLPVLMREIFNRRDIFKKEMLTAQRELEKHKTADLVKKVASLKAKQQAYKILANSGYGALANKYFTFFSIDLAMSITLSGQLSIKWVAKALNEFMNELMETEGKDYIIAVDTDSNYLNCGPLVDKLFPNETDKTKIINFLDKFAETKCQAVIDKAFSELAKKMNAFDPCLKMKREAIAEAGLWTGKKRYCLNVLDDEGVRFEKPKMKATGLEVKRSSVPEICRKALSDCLEIILTKTEDDLVAYVAQFEEKFNALSFYDIARPSGMNGLEKYYDPVTLFKQKCPAHVKGAIVFNEWIRRNKLQDKYPLIADGEKIRWVELRLPNKLQSEVLSCSGKVPSELNIQELIDYRAQFESTFLKPVTSFARVARWSVEREHTLDGAW